MVLQLLTSVLLLQTASMQYNHKRVRKTAGYLHYDQFQGLPKRQGLASQLVDLQLVGQM